MTKRKNKEEFEDYIELPESLLNTQANKSTYSPEVRAQCVYLALSLGNPRRAAQKLGVHYRTVLDWTRTDWWAEIEAKLHEEASGKLQAKFHAVMNKALDRLDERLEKGDPYMTKGGELKYRPVNAKDTAIIISITYDRRALLKGDPTSRQERTSTARERLKKMATSMESLADKPKEQPTPPLDAVKH